MEVYDYEVSGERVDIQIELLGSFRYTVPVEYRFVNSLEIRVDYRMVNSIAGDCGDIQIEIINSLTGEVEKTFQFKNDIEEKERVETEFGFRNHIDATQVFFDQYYFDKGHGLTL